MRKEHKTILASAVIMVFITVVLVIPGAVGAGDLEPPPGGPDAEAGAMYTLEDIYDYLDMGVAGTKRGVGFMEPDTPPPVSGQTPSPTLDDVHDKATERLVELSDCEADLSDCEANLPTCEGILSAGGRWCDNGDGTVKDMTTGLVWLKDASCMGFFTWHEAIASVIEDLRHGHVNCGLSDGSELGDWRLPKINELIGKMQGIEPVDYYTLRFFTNSNPARRFFSSTTVEGSGNSKAWVMETIYGYLYQATKSGSDYIWPVRPDN